MKIYFAGSIRGGRDDKGLYAEIIQLLSTYGQILTEHLGDPNITNQGEPMEVGAIYKRDMSWLHEADRVIAEVTTPSLGVGYEVARAEDLKKNILCIYRPDSQRKLSAMIGGSSNLTVKEYNAVEDLEKIFQEFFGK